MGTSYNNKNNIIIITVYGRAGVYRAASVHEAWKKMSLPGTLLRPDGAWPVSDLIAPRVPKRTGHGKTTVLVGRTQQPHVGIPRVVGRYRGTGGIAT